MSSSQSNAYLVKSDFSTTLLSGFFEVGRRGYWHCLIFSIPGYQLALQMNKLTGSPHPWSPLHPNAYFGCFCLPVPSDPAMGATAPVNSSYRREVFCLFSFMNQFAAGVRWAPQLLQEKKQEQADSVMGGWQQQMCQLCHSLSPGARGCCCTEQFSPSPSTAVGVKTSQLFCAAVAWCYTLTASWRLQLELERKWKWDTPSPPRTGTTFFNDSLHFSHPEVSRELHSIPGCWVRNGADLGSCSSSIFTSIPNARRQRTDLGKLLVCEVPTHAASSNLGGISS